VEDEGIAEMLTTPESIRTLQRKLYRKAKQEPACRFHALYDKVYRADILTHAYRLVRANEGSAGIDGVTFEDIEAEEGATAFVAGLAEALKSKTYKPDPVKRVMIPKADGTQRPLGIPVIKDRVIQMATKLVIEPIFEANFLPCSYGYRPNRSTHMAIREIRSAITFGRQTVVIDGDIMGCFDNIRQDILMNLVGRRISDRRVLKLICGWLRAGVMEDGEWIEPDGLGTPQGGVLSPLLANIYLHSFDKMFQMSRVPGTLVRYADDLVILLRGNAEQVLEQVGQMLGRLGLRLHPEKTRVVRAEDGFEFLGVHFRLRAVRKQKAKLKRSCRLWPSERSMKRIKQKVREAVGRRYGLSLEEMIADLNPVLRGWNIYHTTVQPERKRLRTLNGYVRERLRIFLKRKYSDRSRGCWRVHDNLFVRLGLYQFG